MNRIYTKSGLKTALTAVLDRGTLVLATVDVDDATSAYTVQHLESVAPNLVRGRTTSRYTITIDIEDTPNAKAPEAD